MKKVIESVMVPLDGSALAEAALPIGESIAKRSGSALHLVRVVDLEAAADEARNAQRELETIADRVDASTQVHVRLGAAADQIVAVAGTLAHPLIVMTSHGRTGVGRWAFGSVADRVVHGGGAPVLLIRSGLAPVDPNDFARFLVPLDGSALAEIALPEALELSRLFNATVHFVRVVDTARIFMTVGIDQAPISADIVNQLITDLDAQARNYLDSITSKARAEGFTAESEVPNGNPVGALLEYSDTKRIDLVIMATHGRGGFNRLVFGSVAERLLRLMPTPVLVVPVDAVAETSGSIEDPLAPG